MAILMLIGGYSLLFVFMIIAIIVAPRTIMVAFYTYEIMGTFVPANYLTAGISQADFEFVGLCYLIFSAAALILAVIMDKENFLNAQEGLDK